MNSIAFQDIRPRCASNKHVLVPNQSKQEGATTKISATVSLERNKECARSRADIPSHMLEQNYKPSNWSVLCGRGKDNFNSSGNRRLRILVEHNLDQYIAATSKVKKSIMIATIVDIIKDATNHIGSFIKKDSVSNQWYEVADEVAREKVGQLFREIISQRDPSKKQARKERRKVVRRALAEKKKYRKLEDDSSSSQQLITTSSTMQQKTEDEGCLIVRQPCSQTPFRAVPATTVSSYTTISVSSSQVSTAENVSLDDSSGVHDAVCQENNSVLYGDHLEPLDYKENFGYVAFIFDEMEQ